MEKEIYFRVFDIKAFLIFLPQISKKIYKNLFICEC